MPLYTLAPIDNYEDGKVFSETYSIPYQVITRGENKGETPRKAEQGGGRRRNIQSPKGDGAHWLRNTVRSQQRIPRRRRSARGNLQPLL